MRRTLKPAHRSPAGSRRGMVVALVIAVIAALLSTSAAAAAGYDDPGRVKVYEGESIQAAIDAANPGTTILVYGHHAENLWIGKSDITLVGQRATLSPPENPVVTPCLPEEGGPQNLICVFPAGVAPGAPPAPDAYLSGVSVKGFALEGEGVAFNGIATLFTHDLTIRRNTITDVMCAGVFAFVADGFTVAKNMVANAGCDGINIPASANGKINRNYATNATSAGIAAVDTTNVKIRRNMAWNNCLGIAVTDGADGGYGIQDEDFDSERIRVVKNTANGNTRTCPFGPIEIGLVGIAVGGADDVVVRHNVRQF